jgi:hypothetical protein
MFRRSAFLLALFGVLGVFPAFAETLPSGTKLIVRLENDVDSSANDTSKDSKKAQRDKKPHFVASLSNAVFYNEHEVIPAGSRIEGDVRGSKSTIFLTPKTLVLPDGRKMEFNATVGKIGGSKLKADEKEGAIEKKGSAGEAAQQAGQVGSTGAVIGAVSSGSWEGMGIGAAAGVGAVLIGRKIAGRNNSTVIPAGTQLTLDLIKPLEVPNDAADAKAPETSPDRGDRRPTLRREDPQSAPAPAIP